MQKRNIIKRKKKLKNKKNNIANPAFSEILDAFLFPSNKYTNIGAVKSNVTTYPGFGANLIAMVFAAIRAVEKDTI